jgi:hypothetical protein
MTKRFVTPISGNTPNSRIQSASPVSSLASQEDAINRLRRDLASLSRQLKDCADLMAVLACLPDTSTTGKPGNSAIPTGSLETLEHAVGGILVDLAGLRMSALSVGSATGTRSSSTRRAKA